MPARRHAARMSDTICVLDAIILQMTLMLIYISLFIFSPSPRRIPPILFFLAAARPPYRRELAPP